MRKTRPVIDRFAEKVLEANSRGCLLWNASTDPTGYGVFYLNGRLERAHRVAYWLFYDEFPANFGCHTCDVRLCINPLHIFDGTHKENMMDMSRKRRSHAQNTPGIHIGIKNPNAKLSDEDITQIRSLYQSKQFTQIELAKRYCVRQTHISRIVRLEQRVAS